MSTYMKRRIEVQSNYGALIVYVDHDSTLQSDEESTEPVVKDAKPINNINQQQQQETRFSLCMDEDVWWQMNQNFACDAGEEEFYKPTTTPTASSKATTKQVQTEATNAPPELSDEVWMELNQDFARDNSHEVEDMEEEEENKPVVVKPMLVEESYADYDMWGECCDYGLEAVNDSKPIEEKRFSMDEDVWWKMNKDFARDGEEEEDCKIPTTTKKAAVVNVARMVSSSSSTPSLDEDDWMEMNQDFARDNSHVDMLGTPVVKKTHAPSTSLEESYGDYEIWGECQCE